MNFTAQLHEYAQWRKDTVLAIEMYCEWCERYEAADEQVTRELLGILNALNSTHITLAFAAEFSRGKTELINALFYSEMGLKLLPTAVESARSCPSELFYDETACYIRLLDIETRLEDSSLIEYKRNSENWTQIELDCDSLTQMQEAFKELSAVKKVSREHAYKLGLWNEREVNRSGLLDAEELEIPCWRYALISLPHPILKQGLCILDTAGLNVLRVEPELTLTLFPSAEAIIFVLATDSDDTSFDLEIWRNYINRVRRDDQAGVAVAMNKIDALWDGASNEVDYRLSIASQLNSISEKLGIDKQLIFPVSARQALMAKINSDADLLGKSCLANLDSYLSDSVLSHRRQLSKQSVINNLVFLLNKSLSLSETKYKYALDQLEEFKQIDCDNADMISKLMAETQERQQVYLLSVEKFQASRRVFRVQARALVDALSKEKVNLVIQRSKDELTKGLTTYALKQNIQLLFDDLREVLLEAVETANETQELVTVIHRKFGEKYGFKDVEVKLFSLDQYQFQLEQILTEGEIFRSSLRTTMTEQSIVVKKLYSSIISEIRAVFNQANQDAIDWSDVVLLPLMRQIKEHKKQIESRLYMLRKISDSKEGIVEDIAQLEATLVPLKQQFNEIQVINKTIRQR